ncbi:MAG: 4-(cytidine 5'-diphospho)-2-C-methyl-D-erythritol kinase [Dysgonamonadaceae bacterium]|jgi:4-diphosphocytidyl-2-C-methyl-D-erythritol kinase|nr:4-(cytidine 5'-diphospho)-2-C-methyl-D-erythritol kinase [Dysgonamonadaceae bacterium]
MICFPNVKINLGLNIVSKREDGYHNIETVFYPIALKDSLEIVPAKGSKGIFVQSGIPVDGKPDNNLVIKAYHLFKSKFSIPEIDIYLRKNIPSGAGLGGGSADAAFMIKLLNDFAESGLNNKEMEDLAAQLGADCPFFIENKPVFAEGIGNVFSPMTVSLEDYHIVVNKPDTCVSTQEAYAHVRTRKPIIPIREILSDPVETWKDRLVNDFEASVFEKYPEIEAVKKKMYDDGAVYASMSGSGSAVFGIFGKKSGG